MTEQKDGVCKACRENPRTQDSGVSDKAEPNNQAAPPAPVTTYVSFDPTSCDWGDSDPSVSEG